MTIERLKRVMWRLQERFPGQKSFTMKELDRAIMYELGTDRMTIWWNRKALMKLGWLKSLGSKRYLMMKDAIDV